MPISGQILSNIMTAQMISKGLIGEKNSLLAQAISSAIASTFLSTATYIGTSTGLGLGAGVSTGKITGALVIGPSTSGFIFQNMTAMGLIGEKSFPLAQAIGSAISIHMNTAIVTGTSTVVASGAGTGVIVGVIGPALGGLILANMASKGLVGQSTPQLSQAIGLGVQLATTASIVTTSIVGVPVGPVPPAFPPIPAAGTDTGKIT